VTESGKLAAKPPLFFIDYVGKSVEKLKTKHLKHFGETWLHRRIGNLPAVKYVDLISLLVETFNAECEGWAP
jgi:hypothetical protein